MSLPPWEEALAPILARYSEEYGRHAKRFGVAYCVCSCGWEPEGARNRSRAVGLHVAAAHKRARKVYDAEVAALIAERRHGEPAAVSSQDETIPQRALEGP